MKNLYLNKTYNIKYPELNSAAYFCISHLDDIFVYTNNIIYKLSTRKEHVENLYNICEYYVTDKPQLVHMSINSISECLCLIYENGDVLTLDTNSKEVQCVGSVESGIKAAQWSPDQEIMILITGQNTVLVMTVTFDPITEVDLCQSGFGERQFITVGWGKKETQFHGSEGKSAARIATNLSESISTLDDGKPQITWRGDGSLFAVSVIQPDSNNRQIRIFSREGVLQYTGEHVTALEGTISWRPSGSLIAASQRLPNKHVIAFFEKNGLRHGDFTLPFAQNECRINQLLWNSESSILAVWGQFNNGSSCLQLWTVNNYHWYLKQNLSFPAEGRLLGVEWDMLHGNRLHVICEGLTYICFDWGWTINHSYGKTTDDGAYVAVIDGAKVLMTSFRKGIVPPPLCGQILQLPKPVNNVVFAPPVEGNAVALGGGDINPDNNSNALCTVLCDGTIVMFTYSSSTKTHVESYTYNLECLNTVESHHWLWIKYNILLCCYTRGTVSYLKKLYLDISEGKIKTGEKVSAGGVIVSLVMSPCGSEVLVQLENGTLYNYTTDENNLLSVTKSLPEVCENLQVCSVDGKNIILGLSARNRLYIDGEEVANNVTSLTMHSEFILLTTLKHMLLCVQLSQKGLHSLMEGKCGTGRRIERGARLVIAVARDTRVVLQMPRGNLECIQPRPLTLHVAASHLDARQYRLTFELLRKQRINLNLLCDHQPKAFLADVDHVVNELQDPTWISLFLSELQEENVTQNMYKDYYAHMNQMPDILHNKVQVICDAMREAMQQRQDSDKFLLPILTSYVQKHTDRDLSEALLKVKGVKEGEKENNHLTVTADEALKYLLYLVDVNRLYDVALGIYDFDLVMLVAAKSNKDPKEYLPFLNELRRMELNYSHFVIDKHLKRYESALRHIALCSGEDQFKECIELVKAHKLYSQALVLFPKDSSRYLEIAAIYGDYLMENRLYEEAGIMYTRAEKHQKALTAYHQAGDWRETLLIAKKLQYEENMLHELCHDVVSRLKNRHQYREAAEVLSNHLQDLEESIAVLVQGKLWEEAVWSSSLNSRTDMIETHVKPGMMEHFKQLSSHLVTFQEQFNKYRTRLNVVRVEKEEKLHIDEKDGDVPDDCDLYSDTSSIMASSVSASHTGSRMSGRSSRSSKNRRKQERKMLSLKEGSPYEEYALIRALHQLFSNAYDVTDEVHNLCQILLKFDKDNEAEDLQKLHSSLLQAMDSAKNEIWTSDLTQQPQMGFGPDSTVNSITTKLQTQGVSNAGLALLESHLRFPPVTKHGTSWQFSILK